MYDKMLMQDVRDFKTGADNIYETAYRYVTIKKIIKNRTKDKKWMVGTLLANNLIDQKFYN